MASDISVPRVGAPAAAADAGRVRGGGQPPRTAVAFAEPPTGGSDAGKPMPNPTLRLDPGLALVVIEFRDGDGKVRETIPTEAQLEAYRASQRASSTPVPPPGQATVQAGPQAAAEVVRPLDGRRPQPGEAPRLPGMPDAGAQPRDPAAAQGQDAAAVQARDAVVAQARPPGDSAVPGLPVKASETGTA